MTTTPQNDMEKQFDKKFLLLKKILEQMAQTTGEDDNVYPSLKEFIRKTWNDALATAIEVIEEEDEDKYAGLDDNYKLQLAISREVKKLIINPPTK